MALLVLAADKGAPGVTTSALALASVWPRPALTAECDPAGGDLAYRLPDGDGNALDPSLGMVSLAAAARKGLGPGEVTEHVQALHGGLGVVLGTANAEQTAGLGSLWPALGPAFTGIPGLDVFADCGRLSPDSPAWHLMPHAAAVLLFSRAQPEQVAHVRDRAAALAARLHRGALGHPPIGVVLVVQPGEQRQATKQVEELLRESRLSAQVIGALAYDPSGAAALCGQGRGRVNRSLLIRSARSLAVDVHHRYGIAAGAESVQESLPTTSPRPALSSGAAAPGPQGWQPQPPGQPQQGQAQLGQQPQQPGQPQPGQTQPGPGQVAPSQAASGQPHPQPQPQNSGYGSAQPGPAVQPARNPYQFGTPVGSPPQPSAPQPSAPRPSAPQPPPATPPGQAAPQPPPQAPPPPASAPQPPTSRPAEPPEWQQPGHPEQWDHAGQPRAGEPQQPGQQQPGQQLRDGQPPQEGQQPPRREQQPQEGQQSREEQPSSQSAGR